MPVRLLVSSNGNPNGSRSRVSERIAHGDHSPGAQLSAADAAFLYLERKEIPLAIASVSIFEAPVPFEKFVASIRSKLVLVPRYRQIVVPPPFDLDLPTWEDDPHFDVRRHIFRVTLKRPGGEAELEALAGQILSQPLDRSKPLWDIHVVDGLQGGRGALIWRLHHALADGVSGVRLMEVMLDATPDGCRAIPRPRHSPSRPSASNGSLLNRISSTVLGTLEGLIAGEKGLLAVGQSLASDRGQNALKGLVALLPELARSVERLPFNKPCSGDRKFCWAEVDLAEVQAIREAAGGTVNDVVLTVLTRALARYVKLHGETVVDRFVRIVCPVSLRAGDPRESLGNQISFLPVALPMDVRSPVRMLHAVSARMEVMKHAGAANLVALAAGCIAAAPAPLQALFWKTIPEVTLPVPLFNMICTDVPGPPVPLYAVGRRMIATYPQVPTGYELGINCAVQSYDGRLFFGLIADTHAAPDVNRLRDFLYVAFDELCRSVGVKREGPKEPRRGAAPKRAARTQTSRPTRAPAGEPAAAASPTLHVKNHREVS